MLNSDAVRFRRADESRDDRAGPAGPAVHAGRPAAARPDRRRRPARRRPAAVPAGNDGPLAHLHADRLQGHRRDENRRARRAQRRPRHHRRPRRRRPHRRRRPGHRPRPCRQPPARARRRGHRRHHGKTAAPGPVAEILGIPAGRRALRRTETREDNGQPASLTVSWYPPGIADRAPRLADSQPLPAGTLAYIAEATGTRATRADEDYAAAPADDDTAAALGISPGSPVLIIRIRYYAADGKLIEYAETTMPAGHRYSRTYAITGN